MFPEYERVTQSIQELDQAAKACERAKRVLTGFLNSLYHSRGSHLMESLAHEIKVVNHSKNPFDFARISRVFQGHIIWTDIAEKRQVGKLFLPAGCKDNVRDYLQLNFEPEEIPGDLFEWATSEEE